MPGLARFKSGKYRTRKGVLTKGAAKAYRGMRLNIAKGLTKNVLYNVKHFKITRYQQGAFYCGNGQGTKIALGMNFSLADNTPTLTGGTFGIPNAAEFAVLFDAFKLNKVVVCLEPQGNVVQFGITPGTGVQSHAPSIHSAIDYNSSAVPTAVNDLVQYNTYKKTRGTQTHKRVFTPRFTLTSQIGGSSVNVMEGQKKWIDANTATNTPSQLPHYGLRIISDTVDNTTENAGNFYWDLRITYYFSFKDNN